MYNLKTMDKSEHILISVNYYVSESVNMDEISKFTEVNII